MEISIDSQMFLISNSSQRVNSNSGTQNPKLHLTFQFQLSIFFINSTTLYHGHSLYIHIHTYVSHIHTSKLEPMCKIIQFNFFHESNVTHHVAQKTNHIATKPTILVEINPSSLSFKVTYKKNLYIIVLNCAEFKRKVL